MASTQSDLIDANGSRVNPRGSLMADFATDRRGSIAVIAAIVIIPMIVFAGVAVDYGRASTVRAKLQSAVDSAALATLNAADASDQARTDIATNVFAANIANDPSLSGITPTVTLDSAAGATVTAHQDVPTSFMQFLQVSSIAVDVTGSALSNAQSRHLEIAMMIDLTGSMAQTRNGTSKISALQTASADLLDILFPGGATTSSTTRVAIVPMADFVNAGHYAATATGLSSTGSYSKINNLASTKNGSYGSLTYSGAAGGGSGAGYGATSGGATYTNSFCTGTSQYQMVQGYIVGTPSDHGSMQGQYAVKWQSWQNTTYYQIYNGHFNPTYASSCTPAADQSGSLITCVTERTGTDAYTDAAPASGSYIGAYNQGRTSSVLNYSSDGKCNVAGRELPVIIPLTNQRSTLDDFFANATVGGGTPGHLGHAWAWYALSPHWASIWPTESAPVAYNTANVTKAAIIMTDGEYNEQYSSATSRTQALALCAAMKTAGIEVYTIGFGFSATPATGSTEANAMDLLTQCSSGTNHYYFPYDGTALRQAFTTIAGALTNTGPRQIRVTN